MTANELAYTLVILNTNHSKCFRSKSGKLWISAVTFIRFTLQARQLSTSVVRPAAKLIKVNSVKIDGWPCSMKRYRYD